MNVLVDTNIWSLALRRSATLNNQHVQESQDLIQEFRVQIIGPIRQEILSGIKDPAAFKTVKTHLHGFEDISLTPENLESAAEIYNACRAKGLQGSHTDFLICAICKKHRLALYTLDQDFSHFAKHISLTLHQIRS